MSELPPLLLADVIAHRDEDWPHLHFTLPS